MKLVTSGNSSKRKFKDGIFNGLTYISSGISVAVLVAIFVFIFKNGISSLSLDLLKDDYWAKNYLTSVETSVNKPTQIAKPQGLDENVSWSYSWGVGFVDDVDQNKEPIIRLNTIDPQSPFNSLIDESVEERPAISISHGYLVENITYKDKSGNNSIAGNVMSQTSKELAASLDQAQSIETMYFKSEGGGIRGSIIATLYLILIAIAIALPLGIFAAVYLHEYASKNRLTSYIRSAVEMLTGVPSIIFGLMGVAVLFPITQVFGATTTNILLGGLTLAIILLPVIIRSTEEALIVVPQSLRDASLSVGANQSQTIFKIVLPSAVPGILTGVLLSIGRVIGESAALIYTMGTYVNDFPTLTSQGTSLAVHIYNIMSSETPNFELACAISIIILVVVFILNISVKLISKRFNRLDY